MENISTWWDSLLLLEKFFFGIAIPFTFFFFIQLVLTFFGGDTPEDGTADFDIEEGDGIGFQFFTLKNLVAFFTIFSWTGIACLDSGLSNIISISIGFVAGLAMMFIMGGLFYFLAKSQESGTLKMDNAIGTIGEVYMELKGQRGNIGRIQVQVQGTLRTLEAITDDQDDLKQGTVVNVTGLANKNLLIVSKSNS